MTSTTQKSEKFSLAKFSLLLLLFSIIFDPGNIHFGIKNISFFLFCLINIRKISMTYIFIPLYFISIFFLSYAHGLMISSPIDTGTANWNITSFVFLIILLFVVRNDLKFLYYFYYLALLFSLYVVFSAVFIFFSIFADNPIGNIVWEHVQNNSDFIMIGFRKVLGIPHPCLYYRTASICIIPESVSLLLFTKTKRKKYLLHFVLFFLELFFSGARANIIAASLILLGFLFAYNLYKKKRVFFSYIMIISFLCLIILIISKVISEREHSNLTKLGHAISFYRLFNSNPIRFFLIGSGPGTIMYSLGTHMNMSLTELSYFELIKNYGFLPSCIMILLFLIPLVIVWLSKKEKLMKFVLSVTYAAFFFIAGTNPLFVGSTGFTTIVCMFYICDKDLYSEFIMHGKN